MSRRVEAGSTRPCANRSCGISCCGGTRCVCCCGCGLAPLGLGAAARLRAAARRAALARRLRRRGHHRALTVGEPDVVDRMLDRVQSRARGEHPAGEDAAHLALQRHLVDLDEGVGVRRLGRRPRVAGARRHLQRAELHGLADRHVEVDDAAGDLVEAGEQRGLVDDLLRRRLGDDLVARLRRGVGRLRGPRGADRRCGPAAVQARSGQIGGRTTGCGMVRAVPGRARLRRSVRGRRVERRSRRRRQWPRLTPAADHRVDSPAQADSWRAAAGNRAAADRAVADRLLRPAAGNVRRRTRRVAEYPAELRRRRNDQANRHSGGNSGNVVRVQHRSAIKIKAAVAIDRRHCAMAARRSTRSR